MNPYHYTECGLDNIIIEADLIAIDDKGEKIVTIPAIGQLHNIIAQGLVAQENALSGTEIRFLRTEMGMTQAELAQLLHRDTQTVGRWERGEVALDATQDIFIRQLAAEKLQLFIEKSVERQSRKVTPKAY
ncbi:MAG: helix-turn-helix domain-containing protein, partial [Proteobacteria bacterium]|nr:helix-turn-helix domain-containing protein [Pseudomonadota bacterium]